MSLVPNLAYKDFVFIAIHDSCSALGPTQPSVQWMPRLFPGSKVTGTWRGFDHPNRPSAEVKKKSRAIPLVPQPTVLAWHFTGRPLHFHVVCSVLSPDRLCGPRVLPQGQSGRGVKLTAHLYLVPRVSISGVYVSLSYIPSWCGIRQLYLHLIRFWTQRCEGLLKSSHFGIQMLAQLSPVLSCVLIY